MTAPRALSPLPPPAAAPGPASPAAGVSLPSRMRQYYALTKPRVVQLIVFCAAIGMLLATPSWPDWRLVVPAVIGIWLVAAAAAAFNCLVEQRIDSRMARDATTARRRLRSRRQRSGGSAATKA